MTSPDYSSPEYWANRFASEREFEWLGGSDAVLAALDPVVDSLVSPTGGPSSSATGLEPSFNSETNEAMRPLQILHFGCGTSSLGPSLSQHLRARRIRSRVVDADYVADSLPPRFCAEGEAEAGEDDGRAQVELIQLDVLDPEDLQNKSPREGWDLVLDKSTADAISCGPDLLPLPQDAAPTTLRGDEADDGEEEQGELLPPIHRLCATLASVTRKGGMWVCVSYSSTRFDHIAPSPDLATSNATRAGNEGATPAVGDSAPAWMLRSKSPLIGGFDGDGVVEKRIPDGRGGERVIWEPETGAWVYILERL